MGIEADWGIDEVRHRRMSTEISVVERICPVRVVFMIAEKHRGSLTRL
jgi:hypothetical protein